MKPHKLLFTTLLLALCSLQSFSQIPRTLSYQGVLTDSLGNPKPDGSYNLTFRLYDAESSGSVLWTEAKTLDVKRGLFTTVLGDQVIFGPTLKFDKQYWLSIQIASQPELSPRIPLSSVGYSLNSLKADTAQYARSAPLQTSVDSARIAGTIPNNSITSQKILDGTIQRVDLLPTFTAPYADTASYARVAPQSSTVDSARIASTVPNNSITTIKIADGTIQRADVVSTFVAPYSDTAQYARVVPSQGFVDSARIAGSVIDNAITSAKIVNGTIASVDIADGAVTTSKINQSGATNGQVLKWNGSTWNPAADSAGGLTLPYSETGTSDGPLININNLGTSGAISTYSSGNYGIWGESGSTSGIGVYGVNKTSTGTTFGVFGDVYSSTGFSGFFQGGKFYVQGNTGIGIQNPSAKLEVNGQVKVTGGSPGVGKVLTSDGVGLATWQTPEPNVWLKNSNNIYYNAGNVGIGLNNPTGMLEIYGNSVDTYPQLLLSETDGFARVSFRTMPASSKHWVLAGHTNQIDGDSQWHLNYFNGSAGKNIFSVYGNSIISFDGKVGIGTTAPGSLLQVHSNTTYANNVTPIIKISDNYKTWNIGLGDPGDRFSISSEDNKDRLTILKSNGYVGLGTTSPSAGLHIKANSWPGSFIYLEANSGSDAGMRFYESTTPKWHIYNNAAAEGLQITNFSAQTAIFVKQSNSYVGIGTTNPVYPLDVAGGVNIIKGLSGAALLCNDAQAIWYNGTYFSWGYQGTYNYFANKVTIGNAANPSYMLYVQGTAYATGSWNSSDARFKKNILPISGALEKIMNVRGTSFEFRSDEFKDYHFAESKQLGFIAQELEDVFPEVVKTESNGYKSVNYNGMIPVLVEAVKDQQRIINDLKSENGQLKITNDQIEAKLKQLKVENEAINSRLEKIEALTGNSAEK